MQFSCLKCGSMHNSLSIFISHISAVFPPDENNKLSFLSLFFKDICDMVKAI